MDSIAVRQDPIGLQSSLSTPDMDRKAELSKPAGSVHHLSLSAGEFQIHCSSNNNCDNSHHKNHIITKANVNHNCNETRSNFINNYQYNQDSGILMTPPSSGTHSRIPDYYRQNSADKMNHHGQDSYSSGYSGMSESHSSGSPYNRDHDDDEDCVEEDQDPDERSLHSGYLNDYSEVGSCIRRVVRHKVLPNNNNNKQKSGSGSNKAADIELSTDNETTFSTFTQSTLLAGDDFIYLEKCAKLADVSSSLPWTDNDVLMVLREGRAKHMSGHITVEIMQRISFLLQRPLVRIVREVKRLSLRLNMCTKHEIETAFKAILPRSIAHSCQQACMKALTLYTMSGDSLKQSKSSRCGLKFSVGKCHRWLVMARAGMRVHEFSAIYLAACVENLLEEIVLRGLEKENLGENVWNLDILEYGISSNAELWGLLQPYEHLICGRNAFGVVTLPIDYDKAAKASERQYEQETLEQCMLATCVGSLSELGYLVYEVMHDWYLDGKNRVCQKKQKSQAIYWSPDALHTLYTYTKCSDMVYGDGLKGRKILKINTDRQYNLVPPLYEWIKTIVAFTEHRGCCMVTPRDVQEGARVLLPGNNCPPVRPEFLDQPSQFTKRKCNAAEVQTEMQRTMVQNLLFGGNYELFGETLISLGLTGKEILNSADDKGLTMLMQASIQGNEDALLTLLNNGAEINNLVPHNSDKCPCTHPMTKLWSALHFAVSFNHASVVQRLLDRGANIEGFEKNGDENVTVTPLQLACASGHTEIVSMLLSKGADPYLHTTPKNGVSFTYNRGGISAFSMAAMHGHKDIVKLLLRQPVVTETDNLLSLEEILQEGMGSTTTDKGVQYHIHSRIKNYHIYEEIPGESIYQSIDGCDMASSYSGRSATHPFRHRLRPSTAINNPLNNATTKNNKLINKLLPNNTAIKNNSAVNISVGVVATKIKSSQSFTSLSTAVSSSKQQNNSTKSSNATTSVTVLAKSSNNQHQRSSSIDSGCKNKHVGSGGVVKDDGSSAGCFVNKLSQVQLRVLKDAIYNAAENGFLETVSELRIAGLQWTLHTWSMCLEYSFEDNKLKFIDSLLGEFQSSLIQDVNEDFVRDTVPLLFDMLKLHKEGELKVRLANVMGLIHGKEPLPKLRNIKPEDKPTYTRIDPRYLNNPEHSDVHFVIEGKTFYAHKVALVQCSQRFRAMLTNAFPGEKTPVIELHDVRYKIFNYMMNYLYKGHHDLSVESKDIIELLGSAHFFMLDGLQRYCESLCTKKINIENCVTIYKNAKLFNATELISYCEGYFLQNLSTLLTGNESFRKMVYSSKRQTYNLLGGVMATLTDKLEAKLETKRKLAPGIHM